MQEIRILKPVVLAGSLRLIGAVAECEARTARDLIRAGQAEAVEAVAAESPIVVSNTEPETKPTLAQIESELASQSQPCSSREEQPDAPESPPLEKESPFQRESEGRLKKNGEVLAGDETSSESGKSVNISVDNKSGYAKFWRSSDSEKALRWPHAFALLAFIAIRANWSTKVNAAGLKLGEALVGDWKGLGWTEGQYRGAKRKLEKLGLVSFRGIPHKGTVARLQKQTVFDVNVGYIEFIERNSNGIRTLKKKPRTRINTGVSGKGDQSSNGILTESERLTNCKVKEIKRGASASACRFADAAAAVADVPQGLEMAAIEKPKPKPKLTNFAEL